MMEGPGQGRQDEAEENDDIGAGNEGEEGEAPAVPPAAAAAPNNDNEGENSEGLLTLDIDEHDWAVAIKNAISRDPELDDICDLDCAQLALIEMDDTEAALERVHKLQAFKQEYGITDTVAQGKQMMRECMKLFPGYFLSFSYSPQMDRFVLVMDMTRVHIDILHKHHNAMQAMFTATYYKYQALNPEFEAMRAGVIVLAECGGFDWTKNVNLEMWKKFFAELGSAYPMTLKSVKHFHTSMFMNLLHSMGKPFMPEEHKRKFEMGCISPVGRLDQIYLQPSLEAANERFLARFEHCLQKRYENAQKFKL